MNRRVIPASLIVGLAVRLAVGQVVSAPARLKAGDPAPPLTVGKWVKGDPVAAFEPGKLYVVEFWATWCGPCKFNIPRLTELAKSNPDVTVIGSDIYEEDEDLVEPFVKSMGDKMDYHVATDSQPGKQGAMATGWMKAAGQNSIPTAFLIGKDGKIAWIGHPVKLEPILKQVQAGTYDIKAEAETQAKVDDLTKSLSAATKAKDLDGVLATTKQLGEVRPAIADEMATVAFDFLVKNGHPEEARSRAKAMASTCKSPNALNEIAWVYATQPSAADGDLAIARQAIDRANELTHDADPGILDTSARLYAVQKNWARATDAEQKAVTLASGDTKAGMLKVLDAYQNQQVPSTTE